MPPALQANVPKAVFVNADGSTSQYGTIRVTPACPPTNPNEPLVRETSPSLAPVSETPDDTLGVYEPALPITAIAFTPRRSSPRWFQVARFHRNALPGSSSALCVPCGIVTA